MSAGIKASTQAQIIPSLTLPGLTGIQVATDRKVAWLYFDTQERLHDFMSRLRYYKIVNDLHTIQEREENPRACSIAHPSNDLIDTLTKIDQALTLGMTLAQEEQEDREIATLNLWTLPLDAEATHPGLKRAMQKATIAFPSNCSS